MKLTIRNSLICGLLPIAVGLIAGFGLQFGRSRSRSANENHILYKTTTSPSKEDTAVGGDVIDEYRLEFETYIRSLSPRNLSSDWRADATQQLTALKLLAKRDATTQTLINLENSSDALEHAFRLYNSVGSVVGVGLVEEVALAYAMRDATTGIEAIKVVLPRPDQLRVLAFLEEACAVLDPDVSVLSNLLFLHEEARPRACKNAIEAIKSSTGPLRIILPKEQRKTMFLAMGKYFGPNVVNSHLVERCSRSDDRWLAAEAMVSAVPPEEAFGSLQRLTALPGWQRQETLIAELVRKWSLREKHDTVDDWIQRNAVGRLQLHTLRELRNAMLARGNYEDAVVLSAKLRDELHDTEPLQVDAPALQSDSVRGAMLCQVPINSAVSLLSDWNLGEEELSRLQAQKGITLDGLAAIEAVRLTRNCQSLGDWQKVLSTLGSSSNPALSAALANVLITKHWNMAVQVSDQLEGKNPADQVFQVYAGQAAFSKYGEDTFLKEEALVRDGSIPQSEEARMYAFGQWVLKDVQAASGWLLDHASTEQNQILISTLIDTVQHSDPEAALAWIGTLKSAEQRNRALESLQALEQDRMRRE